MTFDELQQRVAQLQRSHKLDGVLPKYDSFHLPWSEWLHVMWYLAMVAAAIAVAIAASHAKDPAVVRVQFTVAVLLVLVGVLSRGLALVVVPRGERIRRHLCQKGQLVPAAMLQANDQFFDDGNQAILPGNVLVSFDPAALAQPERLQAVAASLLHLKSKDRRPLPPPLAAVAWDLYHELGPMPAVPLPPEHADGLRETYLLSVLLPPKPERLGDGFVVVMLRGETSWHGAAVLPAP